MTYPKVFVVLQVMAALCLLHAFGSDDQLWRLLRVSQARLTSGSRNKGVKDVQSTVRVTLATFQCSIYCQNVTWCNLWCFDSSSVNSCLLFDMFVSPGYQETNTADAISCYTKKPKDYAVGASITGSTDHPATPLRKKTNMIDGIYEYPNTDQCYYSDDESDPWMKVDFGEIHPVKRVMFMMQHTGGYYNYYNFDVRAGVEDYSESQFSLYQQIGFFPGPTTASHEVEFVLKHPVFARYVIIQRQSDPCPKCSLQICHIEIN